MADNLAHMTDDELRAALTRLADAERRITYDMIRHLLEYDRRKLYRRDRVANLWQYCTLVLKLSEDQAINRMQVVAAIKNKPELGPLLERGELSASAIRKLSKALDTPQSASLIEQSKGRPLREVERLAASAIAARDLETTQKAQQAALAREPILFAAAQDAAKVAPLPATPELLRLKYPDRIAPVSGDDSRLEFVASNAFVKNLELLRDLLARRYPQARLEDVLGAALELMLQRIDPVRRAERRRAKAKLPGGEPKASERPAIPAALRDAVLERHGRRCAWVGPDGSRCPERRYLELDHVLPLALGGETTPENLRPLCRGHNRVAAELAFGAAFIERAIARRKGTTGEARA